MTQLHDLISDHEIWLKNRLDGRKMEIFDTKIERVDLLDSVLQSAMFGDIIFNEVQFKNINFIGAYFDTCRFNNCIFVNCNLRKTQVISCQFFNVTILDSGFTKSEILLSTVTQCNLFDCDFGWAFVNQVVCIDCALNGIDITGAIFSRSDFQKSTKQNIEYGKTYLAKFSETIC